MEPSGKPFHFAPVLHRQAPNESAVFPDLFNFDVINPHWPTKTRLRPDRHIILAAIASAKRLIDLEPRMIP